MQSRIFGHQSALSVALLLCRKVSAVCLPPLAYTIAY